MKLRFTVLVLLMQVQAVGCSSANAPSPNSDDNLHAFETKIVMNKTYHRFDVRLHSNSSEWLCMHVDEWPNRLGQVHMAEQVFVEENGKAYPAQLRNFGYCVGTPCEIRIPPGGELRAYILFSEFPGWKPSDEISARLNFKPMPRTCKSM